MTARSHCAEAAETAGTGSALSDNLLVTVALEDLPQLAPAEIPQAAMLLRNATSKRREDIRHLESRHTAVNVKQQALVNQQASQRDRQAELEEAAERRAEADLNTETAGNELIDAWHAHCASAVHTQ